jgi:hypothetical protein
LWRICRRKAGVAPQATTAQSAGAIADVDLLLLAPIEAFIPTIYIAVAAGFQYELVPLVVAQCALLKPVKPASRLHLFSRLAHVEPHKMSVDIVSFGRMTHSDPYYHIFLSTLCKDTRQHRESGVQPALSSRVPWN